MIKVKSLAQEKKAILISKPKQFHPTLCPLLDTILKPAEASQQCLWGQMSIKRGEKTIEDAKLESVTCVLPSHTIETWRLGPSGDLYAQ